MILARRQKRKKSKEMNKPKWRLLKKEKPEDGKWIIAISKDRRVQRCRYKWDAEDHYFPPAGFSVEETVAWIYDSEPQEGLDEIEEWLEKGERK